MSADLEPALLVQLFGMPVNVALGSSALMVALAAAGGLLGHVSTGGASWGVPHLPSVSVLAASQLGRRSAMRKRFETGPCGLASTTPVNSLFLAPDGKQALSLFNN